MIVEIVILTLVYSIPVVALAILTWTYVHEFSHYTVGRIWTDEIRVLYTYRIVPHSVRFDENRAIPDWGIRVLAVAPQIFTLPLLGVLYFRFELPLSISSLDYHFVALYIGLLSAALITSPADLIALFYPKDWRGLAETEEPYSHIDNAKFLIKRVSEN